MGGGQAALYLQRHDNAEGGKPDPTRLIVLYQTDLWALTLQSDTQIMREVAYAA